jgi:hypothetical protein
MKAALERLLSFCLNLAMLLTFCGRGDRDTLMAVARDCRLSYD